MCIDKVKLQHLPQKLPMVCEPKDWVYCLQNDKSKFGVYLLNDIYYANPLIKHNIKLVNPSALSEQNLVMAMVTDIVNTPYKINVDTLELIYKFGIKNNIITDYSSKDIKDFLKNPYKKSSSKFAPKYRAIVSKILMERNILSIADTYSKVERIYFAVRLESRLELIVIQIILSIKKRI